MTKESLIDIIILLTSVFTTGCLGLIGEDGPTLKPIIIFSPMLGFIAYMIIKNTIKGIRNKLKKRKPPVLGEWKDPLRSKRDD